MVADSFLLKCFGLDNLISAASAAFFNYPSSTTFRYTSSVFVVRLRCVDHFSPFLRFATVGISVR
jgi:hypothetical protein